MSMNNAAYMQSHSCKVGAIKKKIAKDLFTAYYAKQTYHHACGIYYKHDKKTIFCITNQQLNRTLSLSFRKLHSDDRNSACRLWKSSVW